MQSSIQQQAPCSAPRTGPGWGPVARSLSRLRVEPCWMQKRMLMGLFILLALPGFGSISFQSPVKNHCSDFKHPSLPEGQSVPTQHSSKTWPAPVPAGKSSFRLKCRETQLKSFRPNSTQGLRYLPPINTNPTCFVNVHPPLPTSDTEGPVRAT